MTGVIAFTADAVMSARAQSRRRTHPSHKEKEIEGTGHYYEFARGGNLPAISTVFDGGKVAGGGGGKENRA